MTYAINIRTQNKSAKPIYDLWNKVGGFETRHSMNELKYPPHFTFGLFDNIDEKILKSTVVALAENRMIQTVLFQSICYFDVSPLVLWLKAQDEQPLFEIHQCIFNILPEKLCRPHYKPGAWQPHCTLGFEIEEPLRDQAIALTKEKLTPFKVVFDTVDFVRFPPVDILGEIPLKPNRNS